MSDYQHLHLAADRLEDLAEAAAAGFAEDHGADSDYAGAVDSWLGGPAGELAAVFTPDTARAVAYVIRQATGQRVPPAGIYDLADLILGEED